MLPAPPPRTPPVPTPIALSKLLLVEGNTPMHLFEALLRHLGLAQEIEIRNYGGIAELRTYLQTLAATPKFGQVSVLGVVRDAETDAVGARQSVSDALAAAGLTAGRNPPLRTSVFILPNNSDPGMIETLCMTAVANEPALAEAFGCVEDFFVCLRDHNIALPAGITFAKHHAQAFLATRPNVQLFPGLAAYSGYWPWDNAVFEPLKQFLGSL